MKRLIFRLSSLGDLILSQSILEPPYAGHTHWVVAKEFEALVAGNPKIAKVWSFDRRAGGGLGGWIRFLAELRKYDFDEVLDAHATLRTWIARIYFRIRSPKTRWKGISKERGRRIGYEMLKRAWPREFRPAHLSRKCALLAGGYGNERPNLRWMLGRTPARADASGASRQIGVVPSSAWPGKEWPPGRYLEWAKTHLRDHPGTELYLLGTSYDRSAIKLRDAFRTEGVPFYDGIGKHALRELPSLLAECAVVIGSDTGLLHLAEAIGTPVVTIFGPTRADFGFGPLDERSKPVEPSLWCSPCSKDGSLCFRPIRRYKCLETIGVASVEAALKPSLPTPSLSASSSVAQNPERS